MLRKIWEKCVNYETVSYLICGVLTTAVDFAVYTVLRNVDVGVGVSQALSWLAAVLFAYVVNKLIVFRNYNMRPSYLAREVGTFVAARAFWWSWSDWGETGDLYMNFSVSSQLL